MAHSIDTGPLIALSTFGGSIQLPVFDTLNRTLIQPIESMP
ncbi:uncharacterized protein G2W53_000476 [Senna tora]|uniref:Uncharacterized protein n=1 Tax=Senna tora TaxID=362788 RepID=A0A835CJH7_9FABA|nr:uncharacterized protein G2W53_000476 [Senna tora]